MTKYRRNYYYLVRLLCLVLFYSNAILAKKSTPSKNADEEVSNESGPVSAVQNVDSNKPPPPQQEISSQKIAQPPSTPPLTAQQLPEENDVTNFPSAKRKSKNTVPASAEANPNENVNGTQKVPNLPQENTPGNDHILTTDPAALAKVSENSNTLVLKPNENVPETQKPILSQENSQTNRSVIHNNPVDNNFQSSPIIPSSPAPPSDLKPEQTSSQPSNKNKSSASINPPSETTSAEQEEVKVSQPQQVSLVPQKGKSKLGTPKPQPLDQGEDADNRIPQMFHILTGIPKDEDTNTNAPENIRPSPRGDLNLQPVPSKKIGQSKERTSFGSTEPITDETPVPKKSADKVSSSKLKQKAGNKESDPQPSPVDSRNNFHVLTGIPTDAQGEEDTSTLSLAHIISKSSTLATTENVNIPVTTSQAVPASVKRKSTEKTPVGEKEIENVPAETTDRTIPVKSKKNNLPTTIPPEDEDEEPATEANVLLRQANSGSKVTPPKGLKPAKPTFNEEKFQELVHKKFVVLICNMMALCIFNDQEVLVESTVKNISNTFADNIENALHVNPNTVPLTEVEQAIFLDENIDKTIEYFKQLRHWQSCEKDKKEIAKIRGCENVFPGIDDSVGKLHGNNSAAVKPEQTSPNAPVESVKTPTTPRTKLVNNANGPTLSPLNPSKGATLVDDEEPDSKEIDQQAANKNNTVPLISNPSKPPKSEETGNQISQKSSKQNGPASTSKPDNGLVTGQPKRITASNEEEPDSKDLSEEINSSKSIPKLVTNSINRNIEETSSTGNVIIVNTLPLNIQGAKNVQPTTEEEDDEDTTERSLRPVNPSQLNTQASNVGKFTPLVQPKQQIGEDKSSLVSFLQSHGFSSRPVAQATINPETSEPQVINTNNNNETNTNIILEKPNAQLPTVNFQVGGFSPIPDTNQPNSTVPVIAINSIAQQELPFSIKTLAPSENEIKTHFISRKPMSFNGLPIIDQQQQLSTTNGIVSIGNSLNNNDSVLQQAGTTFGQSQNNINFNNSVTSNEPANVPPSPDLRPVEIGPVNSTQPIKISGSAGSANETEDQESKEVGFNSKELSTIDSLRKESSSSLLISVVPESSSTIKSSIISSIDQNVVTQASSSFTNLVPLVNQANTGPISNERSGETRQSSPIETGTFPTHVHSGSEFVASNQDTTGSTRLPSFNIETPSGSIRQEVDVRGEPTQVSNFSGPVVVPSVNNNQPISIDNGPTSNRAFSEGTETPTGQFTDFNSHGITNFPGTVPSGSEQSEIPMDHTEWSESPFSGTKVPVQENFQEVYWRFKIKSIPWSEVYDTTNSTEAKELKEKIEPELTKIFDEFLKESFIALRITKFSEGSIVVHGTTTLLNVKMSVPEVEKEFENSIRKRGFKVGQQDVESTSIRLAASDQFTDSANPDNNVKLSGNEASSGGGGLPGYVIGIIIACILAVLFVIGGFIYFKRYRNRSGSSYIQNGANGAAAKSWQPGGQAQQAKNGRDQTYSGPSAYEMSNAPQGQAQVNHAYQRDSRPSVPNGQGRATYTPHPASKV